MKATKHLNLSQHTDAV